MKLIHYTFRNLSIALGIILMLWAIFFYIQILHEVEDETNDSLQYYKSLIIKEALADSTMLVDHVDIMTKYYIHEVSEEEADLSKEEFYDTFIYSETEMEYVPVRALQTYFRTANNKYYQLIVNTSTLEKDDMIAAIFQSIVILYIILLSCILGVTHFVFRKSLRPFYNIIQWLNNFKLGKKNAPLINKTNVDEFKILNHTILEVTKRNEELYTRQKEFVENAAHELQTPLAICMNKLELLSENPACSEEQLKDIADLHHTLSNVVKLNKSLLLLTRIKNKQFPDTREIKLNPLINTITNDLAEIYEHKHISISLEENATLAFVMNESLAGTLITNLIKNSFIHNKTGGFIHIKITSHELSIYNSGDMDEKLDIENLSNRFSTKGTKKESTGLGLAIIKAIIALYSIQLEYNYNGCHEFKLIFS